MNKLVAATVVGSAAIAVGVLPAASIASAATPKPGPIATVVSKAPTGTPVTHHPRAPHAPGRRKPTHKRTHGTHHRPTTGTTKKPTDGHRSPARPTHRPAPSQPVGHEPAQHQPAPHRPVHQPVAHPPVTGKPVAPPSTTGRPVPRILGGQAVVNAPWAAQVSSDGTGFKCSGSAIAPQWVLTARHCVDSDGMTVLIGSTKLGEGTKATVDKKIVNPVGDMALLHLSEPVRTTYIPLADAEPRVGQINTIYGFGMTGPDSGPADQLRVARVRVTSLDCLDAEEGLAICSTGINGIAYAGDSGGAEISGGAEVGVCSTGDEQAKTQQYASVAANRTWIRSVAQV